jgi:hypothetical protein
MHTVIESKELKTLTEDEKKQIEGNSTLNSYIMIQNNLNNWKEKRRLPPKN